MPYATVTAIGGIVTIPSLAAGTDFQVVEGECYFSISNPGSDKTFGFHRKAGSTESSWYCGASKTVYLQSPNAARIFYEAIGDA